MSQVDSQPLYSVFGTEPDMAELVEMFVEEMPDRINHAEQLFEATDWNELGRFAHQLKGAAGSYGFDQLTPLAANLEQAAKDAEPEEQIHQFVLELIDACQRTRSGGP